jgi:hypothetical protein
MWFLHRKVILTKDNLLKRNWHGNPTFVFCDKAESIQHLFFDCPMAKIVWRLVHMTFGLPPPKSVANLFGNWFSNLNKKDVKLIKIGVCAIVWALWNARNDHVFNKPKASSLLQVIPMATHWIRTGLISNHWSNMMSWVLGATFGDGHTGLIQPIRLAA